MIVGGPSGPDGVAEVAALARARRRARARAPRAVRRAAPHEQLADYYRAADVCVVPSRTESFGLVALEAAACGTPVVAANVGGLRLLVDDGVTGYLVDERDPPAYAALIDRVLARRQPTRCATHAVARSTALPLEHRRGASASSLRRPRGARARRCS